MERVHKLAKKSGKRDRSKTPSYQYQSHSDQEENKQQKSPQHNKDISVQLQEVQLQHYPQSKLNAQNQSQRSKQLQNLIFNQRKRQKKRKRPPTPSYHSSDQQQESQYQKQQQSQYSNSNPCQTMQEISEGSSQKKKSIFDSNSSTNSILFNYSQSSQKLKYNEKYNFKSKRSKLKKKKDNFQKREQNDSKLKNANTSRLLQTGNPFLFNNQQFQKLNQSQDQKKTFEKQFSSKFNQPRQIQQRVYYPKRQNFFISPKKSIFHFSFKQNVIKQQVNQTRNAFSKQNQDLLQSESISNRQIQSENKQEKHENKYFNPKLSILNRYHNQLFKKSELQQYVTKKYEQNEKNQKQQQEFGSLKRIEMFKKKIKLKLDQNQILCDNNLQEKRQQQVLQNQQHQTKIILQQSTIEKSSNLKQKKEKKQKRKETFNQYLKKLKKEQKEQDIIARCYQIRQQLFEQIKQILKKYPKTILDGSFQIISLEQQRENQINEAQKQLQQVKKQIHQLQKKKQNIFNQIIKVQTEILLSELEDFHISQRDQKLINQQCKRKQYTDYYLQQYDKEFSDLFKFKDLYPEFAYEQLQLDKQIQTYEQIKKEKKLIIQQLKQEIQELSKRKSIFEGQNENNQIQSYQQEYEKLYIQIQKLEKQKQQIDKILLKECKKNANQVHGYSLISLIDQ